MPRDDAGERPARTGRTSAVPRPVIEVEPGLLDVIATEAENHMIAAGVTIYQRGRNLVRPAAQEVPASNSRSTTVASFAELSAASAADFMSRAMDFTRFDARSRTHVPINPPRQIADVILSRFGEWKFRPVSGIITTPTLRPDHTVLSEPGYDEATRLYLAPDPVLALPSIPPYPTRQQAADALALLNRLLANFPFVGPVDRSVALSALLTPICRGAMAVAPLHAFRASTAGTGKSFLCDLVSASATGRPCPVVSAGGNADETDKRLVGLLLAGFPIISLDNINGELGGDLLCQAVERPIIRLRRLGGSEISELETRATIFATGNGLRVCGDMTRRTLICDLDAEVERPELRVFAFNPVDAVLADRARYVAAALTVVRAFVVSGACLDIPPLASYADYSATVRGALVWLGRPDPAAAMDAARDDDPELAELRDMMVQWLHHVGIGVDQPVKFIIQRAEIHERDDDTGRQLPAYVNPELRDAILAVAAARGSIDAAAFGRWLRGRKGRIVTLEIAPGQRERLRFEARGGHSGTVRWRLARVPAK